jgi:hypothetical protein
MSMRGESALPPSFSTWATAASSLGTPTYIPQWGGKLMPSGMGMSPPTGVLSERIHIL